MAKVEKQQGSVENFGKVAVEIQGGSYRLRWRYQGDRYCLTIGRICREAKAAAAAKAQMINADILFDRFDPTLAKYSAQHRKPAPAPIPEKIPTLLDLWQEYKTQNSAAVSPTHIPQVRSQNRVFFKDWVTEPAKMRGDNTNFIK